MSESDNQAVEAEEQETEVTLNDLNKQKFQEQIEKEAIKLGLKEDHKKSEEIQVKEFSDLEKEQITKGWDPDGKYDAETYKKVGDLILAKQQASKQAVSASKEVLELKSLVQQLINDQRIARETMETEKLQALERLRVQKISEGDVQGALAIEQKVSGINAVKASHLVQPPIQPQDVPEIVEWKDKHKSWLIEDSQDVEEQSIREAMRAAVGARAKYFMDTNPEIDPKIALEDIDKRLRVAFPKKFEITKPTSKVGVSDGYTSKGHGVDLQSLPDELKDQFKKIHSVDKSYTLKEYVDFCKKAGQL